MSSSRSATFVETVVHILFLRCDVVSNCWSCLVFALRHMLNVGYLLCWRYDTFETIATMFLVHVLYSTGHMFDEVEGWGSGGRRPK